MPTRVAKSQRQRAQGRDKYERGVWGIGSPSEEAGLDRQVAAPISFFPSKSSDPKPPSRAATPLSTWDSPNLEATWKPQAAQSTVHLSTVMD